MLHKKLGIRNIYIISTPTIQADSLGVLASAYKENFADISNLEKDNRYLEIEKTPRQFREVLYTYVPRKYTFKAEHVIRFSYSRGVLGDPGEYTHITLSADVM